MPFDGKPEDFLSETSAAEPIHIQVLRRAQQIIKWRWHWTKDTLACTRRGDDVDPSHHTAVRFCAYGSVVRAANDLGAPESERQKALDLLGDDIETVNDEDGFRAVHRRFKNAIAHSW